MHQTAKPAGFHTIAEFCRLYRISRTQTYRLLGRGELKGVKAGNRTLIPVSSASQWATSLPFYRPSAGVPE